MALWEEGEGLVLEEGAAVGGGAQLALQGSEVSSSSRGQGLEVVVDLVVSSNNNRQCLEVRCQGLEVSNSKTRIHLP